MAKWVTYIGERYSPESFVAEAEKQHGVSRRLPVSQAKAMQFGDVVACMQWNAGHPSAFAEFRIDKIILQDSVADEVLGELIAAGLVSQGSGGGWSVNRECGSYQVVGTYYVTASINEICRLAETVAERLGEKVWVMVGGPVINTFDPPRHMPAYPFFRGFARAKGYARVATADRAGGGEKVAVVVRNYQSS